MKYIILAITLISIPYAFAQAQVDLNIVSQTLTIDLEPNHPDPNTEVIAKLNDYSLPVSATGITWKIDGAPITEAKNLRNVSFTTKDAGKTTTLEATISLQGGGTVSTKKVVNPAYLDIIVEPQTRTPAFYLGRALPSIGSIINLTAVVNGGSISPNELIYTWSVNNSVVEGGQLRGKNKISTPTPRGRFMLVTLAVSQINGEIIAKRTIEIPSLSPKVNFYEINPLYGMNHKPANSLNLVGSSATVQAEPYYLNILTYNSPEHLEWKIDGTTVANNAKNPYEVTLSGQGLSGSSRVNFHVRSLTELLQGGEGDLQVNF